MKKFSLILFLALLLVGCSSPTLVAKQNGIEIYEPQAYAAKTSEVTGIFLTIVNTNEVPDTLLGAAFDGAELLEIHQTTMSDGVMKMSRVDGLEIPAKGMAALKPGGYHIMVINLSRDLAAGDTISVMLSFQNAGEIVVDVPVVAR